MKRNKDILPPAYEGVDNHLLSLFYSGVYITNAEILEVGKSVGLDLPMKDRSALVKEIAQYAYEKNKKLQIFQGFIAVLKKRIKSYEELSASFPKASKLIGEWIHKTNSTILLLQREMRSSPYE